MGGARDTVSRLFNADDTDGELVATRIVEGEARPASVEVVENPAANENAAVNWRDNKFISD